MESCDETKRSLDARPQVAAEAELMRLLPMLVFVTALVGCATTPGSPTALWALLLPGLVRRRKR